MIEFDQQYAAEQLRRSRHPLRRFIKSFYLRNILSNVRGSTIDFGCGTGQLLELLPPGSAGLEINPHLIKELRNSGLTVQQTQGEIQDFELTCFDSGCFNTLVIAHVLEHLQNPVAALRLLMSASQRLGLKRVILVVPGMKGFASDHTHKTFIDRTYLETYLPQQIEGFVRSRICYFPGRWEWVGRYFVYHEMMVIFDRESELS